MLRGASGGFVSALQTLAECRDHAVRHLDVAEGEVLGKSVSADCIVS
jgi:hypothetical protein